MDRETADPIAMMAAQLSRLPGIGRKTATRLAYFIAAQPEEDVRELASALWQGRRAVRMCSRCGNYTFAGSVPDLRRPAKKARRALRCARSARCFSN